MIPEPIPPSSNGGQVGSSITCYGEYYVILAATLPTHEPTGSGGHTHSLTYLLTRNQQQHNNRLLIVWHSGKIGRRGGQLPGARA